MTYLTLPPSLNKVPICMLRIKVAGLAQTASGCAEWVVIIG